jgi:hypothetical protein
VNPASYCVFERDGNADCQDAGKQEVGTVEDPAHSVYGVDPKPKQQLEVLEQDNIVAIRCSGISRQLTNGLW